MKQSKFLLAWVLVISCCAAGVARQDGQSNSPQSKVDPELVPKMLSDDDLFIEKTRIIQQWVGEAAGDQFGWTARTLPESARNVRSPAVRFEI